MPEPRDVSAFTPSELCRLTGRTFNLVAQRLQGLAPVGTAAHGGRLYSAREALERIYAPGGYDLTNERARLAASRPATPR
jgi:hypothetical protein